MDESAHSQKVGGVYSQRAAEYDKSFHIDMARDYLKWAKLEKGSSLLDLASGTGLIAISAKKEVGETGRVVGVDISEGMQGMAKQKAEAEGLNIDWLLGDIGSVGKDSALRAQLSKLAPPQGFDTITCATALILLVDPGKAVSQWVEMLAPGGQLLVDVPHITASAMPKTFHQLSRENLLSNWLCHGLKHEVPTEALLRQWLESAGLEGVETWVSPSYREMQLDLTEPDKVWEIAKGAPTWALEIAPGIDEDAVKARFVELLTAETSGAKTLTEHAQLMLARGSKAST